MASLEDIGGHSHGQYKPKEQLQLGWYPSHIVSATIRKSVKVRQRYRAHIYNIKFKISDAEGFKINGNGSTVKFANRVVTNNGLFYFLSPQQGDDFEENPTGNKLYYRLLKCCKVPMEKLDNGSYLLTEINPSAIIGHPMLIYLDKSKPFIGKEGKKITLMQVRKFMEWDGGSYKKQREGLKLPI
jgi:hypothetical protein